MQNQLAKLAVAAQQMAAAGDACGQIEDVTQCGEDDTCQWNDETGPCVPVVRSAAEFESMVAAAQIPVWGCNNELASNFDADATQDDGSCEMQVIVGIMDFAVGMNCTVVQSVLASYPELGDLLIDGDPFSVTSLHGEYSLETYTVNATTAVYPDEFCVDRSTGQMLAVPFYAAPLDTTEQATQPAGDTLILSPLSTIKAAMLDTGINEAEANDALRSAFSLGEADPDAVLSENDEKIALANAMLMNIMVLAHQLHNR